MVGLNSSLSNSKTTFSKITLNCILSLFGLRAKDILVSKYKQCEHTDTYHTARYSQKI